MLACDFLTFETVFLQRICVLFFISLGTLSDRVSRLQLEPGRPLGRSQARNLIMQLGSEQPFRFLIHDRDTKFSQAFDEVFRTEGESFAPVLLGGFHSVASPSGCQCWQGAGARRTLVPMAVPDIRYARSGDVSIAFQVFGEGPDHVLIRLWMGDLGSMWDQPLLARYFTRMAEFSRVIIFDKRGTGMSDPARAVPTLEARMDDVRAVMDAAGSERAVLSGGGEGARMQALFAATYPERVSALSLVNPSAKGLRTPDYLWARTEDEWRHLLRDIDEGWGTQELSDRLLREQMPSVADNEDFRAWWVTYLRRSLSPGAAVAFYRMVMESDVSDVLPLVRAPTLVFHRDDEPGPAQFFVERIPHSRRIELPGLRDDQAWVRPESIEIVFRETEELVTEVGGALESDRVLATILFTDVVGSTERAAELGDRRWRELLEQHHALVRRELARHRGQEIDTAGDGVFASFDGPARAIRCACAIRDAVRALDLELRSGLHAGECEIASGKLAGIAVHTGARIAAEADSGEVLVSQTVKDLVAGSGLDFDDRGTRELKGLPGEWRLYAVAS